MSDKAVSVLYMEDREQVELLKRTVCKGATDDELRLALSYSKRTGLDLLSRQLYCIRRWDSRERREIMQVQASIDGLRLVAERTGKYEGQMGPFWCGMDGVWHDVWVPNDEWPVAARVGVLKAGCREPLWSVAKYNEYLQTDKEGRPVGMWRKMPANQLAKCAEALSLRKAFPQELSGIYTSDELPDAAPDPPQRPWRTFKEMLELFAQAKAALGPERESTYYEILGRAGVKHSNEFRDPVAAAAAYFELQEAIENFPQAQPETKAD